MIDKLIAISDAKRRLLSNFFSLSVLQGASYLLPLITLPYLVRVLGAEKFGLVAFAQAFIQYFVILTDYGFNLSATREISIHRENKEKVSEIFCSVTLIKFTLTFLSFTVLFLTVFSFGKFKSDWQIYFLTFGMVVGQVLFPVWLFQGMERMKYIAFLSIASKLLFTILIFIVVRKASDYIYVPLINSCGFILAGMFGQILAFRNFGIRPYLPKFTCLWYYFKDSTQFFLSRASVTIYTSSSTFFLGLFTNNSVVGHYSAAEKIYAACRGAYYPLVNALYPYMAKTKNRLLYKKIFRLSILLNFVLCVVLFVFSRQIILVSFGQAFAESIIILRVFSVGLCVVVPSILLGYPFLAALNFARYANGSAIVGSFFHLGALIIISQIYINSWIVAILVVLTECIVLALRVYGIRKHKLLVNER